MPDINHPPSKNNRDRVHDLKAEHAFVARTHLSKDPNRARTERDTAYGQIRFKNALNDTGNGRLCGRKFTSKRIPLELPGNAVLYATGLELPAQLSIDDWRVIGTELNRLEGASRWALGDWWCYGNHQYGRRKAIAKKLDMNFGTMANYGTVARRVQSSWRHELLSWWHHYTVANLEPAHQKYWLDKAEKHQWSTRELRLAISRRDEKELDSDPDLRAHLWFDRLEKFVGRVTQVPQDMEDEPRLDYLAHDREMQNFIRSVRQAAECCNGMADGLDRYWRKRKAQGASFKPRPITEPVRPAWVDVMFGDKINQPPPEWDDEPPSAECG